MSSVPSFRCVVCGSADMAALVADVVKGDRSGALRTVRCGECSHVQLHPPEYDLAFYEKDGQIANVVSGYGTPMRKLLDHSWIEARRRADRFSASGMDLSSFGPRMAVLDVGGGYGFFGAEMLRRAPGAEVIVMEPSANRVETGLSELQALGDASVIPKFEVVLLDEAYVEAHRARFDIVTLWHVVEHLPDPVSIVSLALQLLKPRTGRLCIEVPNFNDDLLTLSHAYRQRHFMVEHISYFTSTGLEALARRADPSANVDVRGYQRYGIFNYFHWAYHNAPQGVDPDIFPGHDRWWLESAWRSHKEQGLTSDALFMIVSPGGAAA